MPTPSHDSGAFDLVALLDALADVELIVVGGVAGALHGSPRVTFDLDIVPRASEENIDRLSRVLQALNARIRDPAGRDLPVDRDLLHTTATSIGGGQVRLRTRHGPLDILWRVHDGRDFEELFPVCVVLADDERTLNVLGIEALIRIKESTGHKKDRDDANYLREIVSRPDDSSD